MSASYAYFVSSLPKEEVIETLDSCRRPVEIAVYGSKNYFNFGSILRLGHGFMVGGYYAIDIPDYYKKAAMTANKWEKSHIKKVSIEGFLEQTVGRNIVAFEKRDTLPKENTDLRFFDFPENPILLFGAEDFGIPEELLWRANSIVTIPVLGLTHDQNVANVCAIALYAWDCQYSAPEHYRHQKGDRK